ncbi:hypothetical protein MMC25_001447 [Agyrium rufum]|nr:hypothetical protein [Agyrium rufum]
MPRRTIHAESRLDSIPNRKPIYDTVPSKSSSPPPSSSPSKPSSPTTSAPSSPTSPSSKTDEPSAPTPTDRLATQVGRARHFIAAHTSLLESRLNDSMSYILATEASFTSTIASLAPEPSTGERVLPNALYVLVAGMASSIVVRNRNILLRATVPGVVGVGAAWYVMPYTMRNVSDLVWRYEERVPVVAMNHLRVKGAVVQGWKEAKVRGDAVSRWAEERVRGGREIVEEWVRKGH